MNKARILPGAVWAAAILAAVFFLASGAPKALGLDTPSGSKADFERWGYPDWFRAVVGLGEVAGAVLLLLPRPRVLGASLRFWGAAGLAGEMLGAFATHLVHAEYGVMMFPLVPLALVGSLAFAGRPEWLKRGTVRPAAKEVSQ